MRTKSTRTKRTKSTGTKKRKSKGQRRRNLERQNERQGLKTDGYHKFVVEGPFCAPNRGPLLTAFQKGIKGLPWCEECKSLGHACPNHAIKTYNYTEKVAYAKPNNVTKLMETELRSMKNLRYGPAAIIWLNMVNRSEFYVDANMARLVEQVVNNTASMYVAEGTVDKNSYRRRTGRLPTGKRVDGLSVAGVLRAAKSCQDEGHFPPEIQKRLDEANIKKETGSSSAKKSKFKKLFGR